MIFSIYDVHVGEARGLLSTLTSFSSFIFLKKFHKFFIFLISISAKVVGYFFLLVLEFLGYACVRGQTNKIV